MLKERTSAHERVRAIVVTGVTPESGVTWRVARGYVLCRVESCVIPSCILGRVTCDSPDGRHARGRGDVPLCCVLLSHE